MNYIPIKLHSEVLQLHSPGGSDNDSTPKVKKETNINEVRNAEEWFLWQRENLELESRQFTKELKLDTNARWN